MFAFYKYIISEHTFNFKTVLQEQNIYKTTRVFIKIVRPGLKTSPPETCFWDLLVIQICRCYTRLVENSWFSWHAHLANNKLRKRKQNYHNTTTTDRFTKRPKTEKHKYVIRMLTNWPPRGITWRFVKVPLGHLRNLTVDAVECARILPLVPGGGRPPKRMCTHSTVEGRTTPAFHFNRARWRFCSQRIWIYIYIYV